MERKSVEEQKKFEEHQAATRLDAIDISFLIGYINEAMIEAKKIAEVIARGVGGREISLTITELESARHRAVDAMMLLESAKNPIESQEG